MVHNYKIEISNKQIRSVTNLSILANMGLFVLKLAIGLTGGSIALVADAFHSLSDMATDFGVLIGTYFAAKAPDQKHPYGH